jgi:hypothetical protein
MFRFYANFIKKFSQLLEPLHALKRKNAAFAWDEPQGRAFEQLKVSISTPPFLQVPDFSKEFVFVSISSDVAISAVLNQRQENGLELVASASRLLTTAERKYSIHEKECLAVVWGCKRFRVYLKHSSPATLISVAVLGLRHVIELGPIGRWILRLAPYKFKTVRISGKSNVGADCLTRQFEVLPEQSFSGLVLQHLPAAFQSIREHQMKDAFVAKCMRRLSSRILLFVISDC